MHVRHFTPFGKCTGSSHEPAAIFLRGVQSWFHQFPSGRETRYEGWYLSDEVGTPHQYWKFIERIEPKAGGAPISADIADTTVRLRFPTGTVTYQVGTEPQLSAALRVESSMALSVLFDMRGIYQYPTADRQYTVSKRAGGWVLSYKDPLLDRTLYLGYRGEAAAPTLLWEEVGYPRDTARYSPPGALWVCRAEFPEGVHMFGAGFSEASAWEATSSSFTVTTQSEDGTVAQTPDAAVFAAERTLKVLTTPAGLYAGFPWFHQVWSRDELIGALGLPVPERISILTRYLALEPENGQLPTYFGSGTTCADGLGWLALLCRETEADLSMELKQQFAAYFSRALEALLGHHKDDTSGLIASGHNHTWMDTIGRVGCRVEIQAMAVLMSELADSWSQQSTWEQWRAEHRALVHSWLVSDEILYDGITEAHEIDGTIRPNVLLALLLDPLLVPRSTWEQTIARVLNECTTSWGGLRSLSQHDPAYQAVSMGESNTSYHQGDSWLMVDGLAAAALLRFDASLFSEAAHRLLRAAADEILWRHVLGYVGEIRAAGDGSSWGCGVQAFSAGGFLLGMRESK